MRHLGLALLTAIASTELASAQISPGPLSRAHAKLEGSGKCFACHDAREGVAPSKCFACHRPLEARVKSGQGLHARSDYADCKRCHVEHQGAEFELVFWGPQGETSFDHAQTGHALVGRHSRLACNSCHKTQSFLGVASACAACHEDPHRGEFVAQACSSCHTQQAWRPAPGFDHAKTSWPLVGRHQTVACERCHTERERPRDPGLARAVARTFRTVTGRDCASCHEDVHKGRFGRDCSGCHTPAAWRGAPPATFDHGRTAYPLEGKHRGLACQKCHAPGRPLRVRHDRCTDCHADRHAGQFSARSDGGRCESCHDVHGFVPARFGPEEHSRTAYRLEGAHLAVACNQCHTAHGPGQAGAPRARAKATQGGPRFRLTAQRCTDCHADPHGPEAWGANGASRECQACHSVTSWRKLAFDHGTTRFPLTGRHASVGCSACHRSERSGRSAAKWLFAGVASDCSACHRDPHEGQFASAGAPTSCERCHSTNDTRATRFDHNRDSAYTLDGAHARLACSACHHSETRDGRTSIRYKPLSRTCRGCHAHGTPPGQGGRT